ncbi:MAG TPA: ABC transporter substrate-binding protein [Polyangia bacterium]|nr:ABC transporter substrate-binding protein [Polyangia bacterium]
MVPFAKLFRIALVAVLAPLGCFSAGKGGCAPAPGGTEACRCAPREAAPPGPDPGGTGDAGSAPTGGELAIRIPSEPGTLLSLLSPHPVIARIIDHRVLEALVELDPATGEPRPELALDWEIDPEKARYVFRLAPRARWHDGLPVTARDVVFTFEQLLDPAGGAVARGAFVDLAAVTALEDGRVAFDLDRHRADFVVSLSRVMVLPAHVFGNERLAGHPAARAPVGSGPLRFVSWAAGSSIALARVEDWRGGPIPISRLVYKVVPDSRVALDLFRAGELDVVPDVEPSPGGPPTGGNLAVVPVDTFEAWVYDTAGTLFSNRDSREAVGRSIDRETLRCSVLACLADLVEGPWPRSRSAGPPAGGVLAYDLALARRLLERAGWRDTDGDGVRDRGGRPFDFTLLVPDGARHLRRVAVMAERDLARVGIRMRPEVVSPSTYASRLRGHRFDAAIVAFDNREPFEPLALFHSDATSTGSNFGRIADAALDGLLDAYNDTVDPAARRGLEAAIGDRLAAQHWMTFTFGRWQQVLFREGVRGLPPVSSVLDERRLRIEPPFGGRR